MINPGSFESRVVSTAPVGSYQYNRLAALLSNKERIKDYDYIIEDLSIRHPRFDANLALATYETTLAIDKRVVGQYLEQSFLRSNFVNFPNEKIFPEFNGIPLGVLTWETMQFYANGEPGSTQPTVPSSGRNAVSPNEMELISPALEMLRRPVKFLQKGYDLTIRQLEQAAYQNVPIQAMLGDRVIRDLDIKEQAYAFTENGFGSRPEERGLLPAIPAGNSITSAQVPQIIPTLEGAAGVDVINMFVNIYAYIAGQTKSAFLFDDKGNAMPLSEAVRGRRFCFLMNTRNANILLQPYSTLIEAPTIMGLTSRNFRIGQVTDTILDDNTIIAYFWDPMLLELGTGESGVRVLPQDYKVDGKGPHYVVPYELQTAGLMIKVQPAVYKITLS